MQEDESGTNRVMIPLEPYKRYCRQLDKEDTLIDQRLNWMIASQSLLFAALGLTGNSLFSIISIIVPIVGLCVSYFVGSSVRAAVSSYDRYRDKLVIACPPSADIEFHFPQLHRGPKDIRKGFKSALVLPWVFLAAWAVVLLWSLVTRCCY